MSDPSNTSSADPSDGASQEPVKGSCVCGAVRYEATGPWMAFQYCHCSRCRKASGAAHAANLFVPSERFTWLEGEAHVKRFDLPDAKYWSHTFCDTCGSALPWQSRTGKAFIIPAGTLDEDPGERPARNIYVGSRAPWYVHASGLPEFETSAPRR